MGKVAPFPVDELKGNGEKLQQAILLTRMRQAGIGGMRLKARASRILGNADRLFGNLSYTVSTATRALDFMGKATGHDIADVFALMGSEKLARGVVYAGMELINNEVSRMIDELAALNVAINNEVKNE